MKKRLLTVLLAFTMIMSLVPASVFAASADAGYTLEDLYTLPSITATLGTNSTNLPLPWQIILGEEGGAINTTWVCDGYNPNTSGTYRFTGYASRQFNIIEAYVSGQIPALDNLYKYDLNGDGNVNMTDAMILQSSYGLYNQLTVYVTLSGGVEGGIETYIVTFMADGSVIKTQTVESGNAATAPANIPVPDGYIFTGWDKDFSNITGNLTVNAVYTALYVEDIYWPENLNIPENVTEDTLFSYLPQTVYCRMNDDSVVEKQISWSWEFNSYEDGTYLFIGMYRNGRHY